MIDIISISGCIIIIIVMFISCKYAMRSNRIIRSGIIIPSIPRIKIQPVQIILENSDSKNIPTAEIV